MEKIKLKGLTERNVELSQVNWGISFINKKVFIILADDNKFNTDADGLIRVTREVDVNRISELSLASSNIQVRSILHSHKKILVVSKKAWNDINRYSNEYPNPLPPPLLLIQDPPMSMCEKVTYCFFGSLYLSCKYLWPVYLIGGTILFTKMTNED